ncbi:MAG: FAD binding domain-containing protein [Deltaproteobacteria bacterium]|nr:FAD binding domain-containing protein [Deltaproteobacteria bacterium]
MHLPRFTYKKSDSLEETAQLLSRYDTGACLMAGGTELLPRMKYGLAMPEVLISMKRSPVSSPKIGSDGDLVLSPLMTLRAVEGSSLVRENAPLLSEAVGLVGSGEIRHMGTLGGNLCQETRCLYYNQSHSFQFKKPCFKRGGDICYSIPKGKECWAVFMGDIAPALYSLEAKVKIMSRDKTRIIPIEGLYRGDGKKPLILSPHEIIGEIFIPGSNGLRGSAFSKFSFRGGLEFAVLSVAAVLDMEDDGETCRSARITVGAVAAAPVRARCAEAGIEGKNISDRSLSEAVRQALDEIRPVPHHGQTSGFLKESLKVQIRHALSVAAGRVKKD